MSAFFAVLTVLLATIAGTLINLAIQRLIRLERRTTHQDVGAVVFLQLGVVFAVLLAFVFSEAWGEYNAAAQSIDLECGALHGTSMLAATLPAPEARALIGAEIAYASSVIRDEWPVLARTRGENLSTDGKMASLIEQAAHGAETSGVTAQVGHEILGLLATAHAEREVRIYQAGSGIPTPLWAVLIVFTTVLVLFVALSGLEDVVVSIAFTGTFAAGCVSILVIARLLDFPFEGALALTPVEFGQLLPKLQTIAASLRS